jgi:hypothetical protein
METAASTAAGGRADTVPGPRREPRRTEVPPARTAPAPAEREYVREHIVLGYN